MTFQDPSAYCRWCERACRQHRCTPLAASSIRVIHAINIFRIDDDYIIERCGWLTNSACCANPGSSELPTDAHRMRRLPPR